VSFCKWNGANCTNPLPFPGKITYSNLSLGEYIEQVYGIKHYQIAGPDWVVNYRSENRYDVIAKAAGAVPTAELVRMLVPLLTERFHLEAHRETRVVPVYALVLDIGGPKFRQGDGGPSTSYPDGSGGLVYKNVSMETLADGLSNFMGAVDGRPVLNRSGLARSYSLTANLYGLPIRFEPGRAKANVSAENGHDVERRNPVFAALQE